MRLQLAERITAAELERLRLVAGLARELGVRAWLVGGAVRDLLLARPSLDLDVVVEGPSRPLAEALAAALGGRLTAHERFDTACVAAGEFHFDVARARRERYPRPGALPEVEPADLREDLHRRDLTFNALALRLDPGRQELCDPWGGFADLRRGLARGLHPQTFHDDPTRLLRLARYAARYGCRVERETAGWASAAVAAGAPRTVSGPRIWLELQRLLVEPTAAEACRLLDGWGLRQELGLGSGDPRVLRECCVGRHQLAPLVGTEDLAPAALGLLAGSATASRSEYLGLSAREQDGALTAASVACEPPPAAFAGDAKNSTLYETLGTLPPAALLALWAAQPQARPALRRLPDLLAVRAEITGTTLQEAGRVPSPGFAPALRAALHARLDYHADREDQLRAALQALDAWQPGREP